MSTLQAPQLVMQATLRLIKPLVTLLLRQGVDYTVFTAALKQVFLDAAHDELVSQKRTASDSAISLLSGLHRRDVRQLSRPESTSAKPVKSPTTVASELVARWLSDPKFLDETGSPVPLSRGTNAASFHELARLVSRDARPKSVLDELLRLGLVNVDGEKIVLQTSGFTPRKGFAEMTQVFGDNLYDHLAAATANLTQDRNFLEQAVYVDEITDESAAHLHQVSVKAWRQAFKTVLRAAQERFDHDAINAKPEQRTARARFGTYFYSSKHD